jgi:hypothetical protein
MHYGGHWRQAFLDWIGERYPPLARVEVNYEEQTWPAEQLLRHMFACSDIIPGLDYGRVVSDFDLDCDRSYGAVARALLPHVRDEATA